MIRSYRGIILLTVFLVIDCILIFWINTAPRTAFVAAPIGYEDRTLVTYVLVGAAAIAVLGAIMFKSKPVPARFR